MLPSKRIGEPKTDHWVGLIDGIYAISMTLMAIEVPALLAALYTNLTKNPDSLGIIVGILIYETISYVATFLILYELWSFHKGAVVIGGLARRGQNFLNSMILVFSCLIPGQMIHLIQIKTDFTLNKMDLQLDKVDAIWQLLNSYTTSSQLLFVICLISFLLLYFLVAPSTNNKINLNLLSIKKSLFNRSLVFLMFIGFSFLSNVIIQKTLVPPLFLLTGYLIFAYYEKDTVNYN